jgi:hypothetical protein
LSTKHKAYGWHGIQSPEPASCLCVSFYVGLNP